MLSVPVTGRYTFFDLGGDSLTATRVLEAIRRRFGVVISLQQLFSAPTVAAVAAAIDAGLAHGDLEEGAI